MRSTMRRAVLWYSIRNRQKKADRIVAFMRAQRCRSLLLCGSIAKVSGDRPNEGVVERAIVGEAEEVLGFDIVPRAGQLWPFVVADGRRMPFADDSYDVVVANAVIEHVGDEADQRRFVAEHTRVGRAWVITTPNRWFPVEAHTSAILKHWSSRWALGRKEFTRLLSKRQFKALLPEGAVVRGAFWSPTFIAYYSKPAPGEAA